LIPLAEKTLDDVDKIVYAREFGVAEWLIPAHVRLCQRETSLTREEAAKVGLDSLLIISHLREKARTTYIQSIQDEASQGQYWEFRSLYKGSEGYTTSAASYFEAAVKAWVESDSKKFD
jgi:hypothetical protein